MNKELQIDDLEVEIAPFGTSESVTGFECVVIIGVIYILIT
jgi:hypothetical protein